jgi:glycosyltransferase involved in cell wall biosynthesis
MLELGFVSLRRLRRLHAERHRRPKVLCVYAYADVLQSVFQHLLEILRYRDHDAFDIAAILPAAGGCSRALEAAGVPVLFGRMVPAGKNLRYLRAVLSFAWRLGRESVDLVYFADYDRWRPAEFLGALLAGVPVVVHLRAVFTEGMATDRCLRSAYAFIGDSGASLGALRGRVPDETLHVVHCFVDFAHFAPAPDRQAQVFDSHPPVVGFVGFFRPEKGIEDFLAMVKITRATRPEVCYLAVGGDSSASNRNWLERMKRHAVEIGVADVVTFTGHRTDIPEVMRSLDVLVVPSLTEGFGRVVVEAGAVGTPVVGANVGGIPEALEDGVTGVLVPPRDPAATAAAVLRVLDDQAWRAQVAAIAPVRVRERFAPLKQVRAIEAIWREALEPGRARSS